MTEQRAAQANRPAGHEAASLNEGLRALPWKALAVAAAAFVASWWVGITFTNVTATNGTVTSCSYFDLLKLVIGIALAGFGVKLFIDNRRKHPRLRLPAGVMLIVTAVLVVAGALAVLNAFGLLFTPAACQLNG